MSGAHGVNAVGHAEAVITRGHASATIRRQLMEANSAKDHSDREIDFVMSTSVQVIIFREFHSTDLNYMIAKNLVGKRLSHDVVIAYCEQSASIEGMFLKHVKLSLQ